jgi:hypothetical protein
MSFVVNNFLTLKQISSRCSMGSDTVQSQSSSHIIAYHGYRPNAIVILKYTTQISKITKTINKTDLELAYIDLFAGFLLCIARTHIPPRRSWPMFVEPTRVTKLFSFSRSWVLWWYYHAHANEITSLSSLCTSQCNHYRFSRYICIPA